MKIIAYSISNPMTIEMPDKKRKWMDETWNGFAYRCLPLTIANGFGWTVLNSNKFKAVWNGGKEIKDVDETIYIAVNDEDIIAILGE